MLKIGEFSKLSRVSIRMLRYYDSIGLLKPAETDSFTGYRYYLESQLFMIGRITSLKEMGFSLSDIVKILEDYEDPKTLDAYFRYRQEELLKLSRETQRQLMLLNAARERLRKGEIMKYQVCVKSIPERYAATLHMVIPHYEDEGMAWQILTEETEALNIIPDEPCLVAASFLDDEYKEENVELIVWKTVKGSYPDTEHVKFFTLPAVKVASCILHGGYEQISEVYAAVMAWIKENGHQCAGPMFNIYHVSPHETQNPDEYVTEVCYPIV